MSRRSFEELGGDLLRAASLASHFAENVSCLSSNLAAAKDARDSNFAVPLRTVCSRLLEQNYADR
jgi:hypothetical protein